MLNWKGFEQLFTLFSSSHTCPVAYYFNIFIGKLLLNTACQGYMIVIKVV